MFRTRLTRSIGCGAAIALGGVALTIASAWICAINFALSPPASPKLEFDIDRGEIIWPALDAPTREDHALAASHGETPLQVPSVEASGAVGYLVRSVRFDVSNDPRWADRASLENAWRIERRWPMVMQLEAGWPLLAFHGELWLHSVRGTTLGHEPLEASGIVMVASLPFVAPNAMVAVPFRPRWGALLVNSGLYASVLLATCYLVRLSRGRGRLRRNTCPYCAIPNAPQGTCTSCKRGPDWPLLLSPQLQLDWALLFMLLLMGAVIGLLDMHWAATQLVSGLRSPWSPHWLVGLAPFVLGLGAIALVVWRRSFRALGVWTKRGMIVLAVVAVASTCILTAWSERPGT